MAISKHQPMRQAEIALIDAVNAGGGGGGGFNVLASGTTEQVDISASDSYTFDITHDLDISNYLVLYTVISDSNIPNSTKYVDLISHLVYQDEMEFQINVTNVNTVDYTSALVNIDWMIVERID